MGCFTFTVKKVKKKIDNVRNKNILNIIPDTK